MTTSLTLATQKPFGTLTCDFYKNDSDEFYASSLHSPPYSYIPVRMATTVPPGSHYKVRIPTM